MIDDIFARADKKPSSEKQKQLILSLNPSFPTAVLATLTASEASSIIKGLLKKKDQGSGDKFFLSKRRDSDGDTDGSGTQATA
jgi:hypothetical protein